jgi:uncharacterized protein
MQIQNKSEQEIRKIVTSTISKHLDIDSYEVFIFGSRATNKGSDRSDIDIGIKGEHEISNIVLGKIKEDFDNLNILYKFDVVDFSTVSEDFEQVALSNSIKINHE